MHDIRGFIHRVAGGVKDAGKKTWNAIRDPFVEEEENDAPPPRRQRRPQATPPPVALARPPEIEVGPPRREDEAFFDARTKSRAAGGEEQPLFDVPENPGKPGMEGATVPFQPSKPAAPQSSSSKHPPDVPKAAPPAVEQTFEFARPVLGKRGLVYPPGVEEKPENMVDVSGLNPGQLVRDPRSGKLFRVP